MKKKILSSFLFLIGTFSFAQITTSINPSIAQIQSMLQSSGISISSISLTCPTGAYATFNNGISALGGSLDSGILLTTGTASNIAGPNTTANNLSYQASAPGSILGDTIIAATTFDACYLDVIFTPTDSIFSVNYLFASEEYPEYSNMFFADLFALVLTGPNPSGGNFNGTNIAVVPGTSSPLSINSINNGTANTGPCLNCAYYQANPSGLAYDGCTTVLTASTLITPTQQYTMTIGIWDCDDEKFDSGVFLDFGNPSCAGTSTLYANSTPNSLCTIQSVTLSASGGLANASYNWTSSINGNLANTTGQNVIANPSTSSSYILSYHDSTMCLGVYLQKTINVNLVSPSFSVTSSSSSPICAWQSTTLTATAGTGSYTWTPNTFLDADNVQSVVCTPTASTIYTVNFEDAGGCTSTSTVDVQVSLCTGIKSITDKDNTIRVFPNPVNSKLYFNSSFNITEIKVFNQNGQQLVLPIYSDYINCSQLNSGVYTIEFKIEQTTIHKKFVKMD